jgi:hypothetical protein
MDSFLLNKKCLEEVSILPKNFYNMHIARRNMHIAIESILPLTQHTDHGDAETKIILPLSLMKAYKHHALI